jgi:tetratricopeptide (TPR) repeat protein
MQPSYATGHHWYALLLRDLDRLEESHAAIARARKLDPVSRVIATVYATTYYMARDYEKAIAEYQRILSFDSTFAEAHRWLARSYVLNGDVVAAEQHARAAARFSGVDESKDLGFVLAHAGKRAEAAAILQGLINRSRNEYVAPSTVAVVATALGQQSLALRWLARAIDEFDSGGNGLRNEPLWDPLRADARFSAILAHANLR